MIFHEVIFAVSIFLRKLLITIYFWTLASVGCFAALIIIVPPWIMGAPQWWCRQMIEIIMAGFPSFMMRLVGIWSFEYIDNRKEKIKGPYVIVVNHLSVIDTVFMAMIPFDTKFTWKKKWSYVPIFGWLCLLAGHIAIDCSNDESKKNALKRSRETLEDGYSMIFYSEGTRGQNPATLLKLKTGAFRVAKSAKKKIIPITIIGTYDACARGVCDTAIIKIIIDEPVDYDEDITIPISQIKNIIQNNINLNMNILRNKGTSVIAK